MLFNLWLDQPAWVIMAVLLAGFAVTGGIVHQATYYRPARRFVGSLGGVAPPVFSTVGLLFGLLTGFLANDVWERQRQANRAVQVEHDAVLTMGTLSIATVSDMAPIRAALRAYVVAVADDEWPHMTDQEQSVPAEQALAELLRQVASPKVSAEAGTAAHGALLNLALQLGTARSDRLVISGVNYDEVKWATVLILGVLTQMAIGLVHLDRSRAQLAALGMFTAAAVVTLGLLAVRERPFDGAHPISPALLRSTLPALQDPT